MKIALTGATGLVGRSVATRLNDGGHQLTMLSRGDAEKLPVPVEPASRHRHIRGAMDDRAIIEDLCSDCDVVIHAAWHRGEGSYNDPVSDPVDYFRRNVIPTVDMVHAAARSGVRRFIFISSGAVHGRVRDDGSLDESHPMWAGSIYGSAKGSIETLLHAYGFGGRNVVDPPLESSFIPITLRPTSIYGLGDPIETSRFFDLVGRVVRGGDNLDEPFTGGGKYLAAAELAAAIDHLMTVDADRLHALIDSERRVTSSDSSKGLTFNCTGGWVDRVQIARMAAEVADRLRPIDGTSRSDRISGDRRLDPREMKTTKLTATGFSFRPLEHLQSVVEMLVRHHLRHPHP